MSSNGYLKTVRVGGFDKQDVLAYVDELNSKIYKLEGQVKDLTETNERLENEAGGAAHAEFEEKAEYERKI